MNLVSHAYSLFPDVHNWTLLDQSIEKTVIVTFYLDSNKVFAIIENDDEIGKLHEIEVDSMESNEITNVLYIREPENFTTNQKVFMFELVLSDEINAIKILISEECTA